MIFLLTVEGDRIIRNELFDETDLDAALTRFDELHPQASQLENAASQAYERFRRYFAAREWAAMAELLTADTTVDDHRRVVNADSRRGREVEIENMRAFADIGAQRSTSTVVATRGERLVLCRTCISDEDQQAGGFRIEMLIIVETTADKRIQARVAYDPDDIDSAIEELDARYLAGEAATYAQTWALITATSTAFNRHEMFPTTPDWVNIDHRRAAAFAPGEMSAYTHAIWEDAPDSRVYIEAVHRLNSLGAVVTEAAHGTSQQGFEAEWRLIGLSTVDHDLINRSEMFDEADLDAALARFDELQPQARRVENVASQLIERFQTYFAARNWAAIADISAEEIFTDDRRSVVSSGILRGRDVDLANIRATADLGATGLTSTVIATRGERIALARLGLSGRDQRPEAFRSEMLGIVEIDAGNRFAARILFDLDDFDSAIAELDARYVAGEAAAHADRWSVIVEAHAQFNRQELPATTPDPVYIDHRPLVSIEGVGLAAALRAVWDITPTFNVYIEAVHRLDELGAVATQVLKGTTQEGLDAEWRDDRRFSRSKATSLNRAESLRRGRPRRRARPLRGTAHTQAPRLENAASRGRRPTSAITPRGPRVGRERPSLLADDSLVGDRRRDRECRSPATAATSRSRYRGRQWPRPRCQDRDVGPSLRSAGERLALTRAGCPGPRPAVRGTSAPRCSASSSSTLDDQARGARHVRPRRHRRGLRRARRSGTSPAKRPPTRTHMVGHRRRPTPRSTAARYPNLRTDQSERRPPAWRQRSRLGR